MGWRVLATAPGPGRPAVAGSASATSWRPIVFGLAILGSAFLLAWAAEVLQLDVSQGLALTVLALIAVLPEYAVDFTFAWKAGRGPRQVRAARARQHDRRQPAAHRHRLVDGGAARGVADDAHRPTSAATRASSTPTCTSSDPHAIEIAFLAIATLYSLTLPFKRTLTLFDAVDPHRHLRRVRVPASRGRRRRSRTSSARRG